MKIINKKSVILTSITTLLILSVNTHAKIYKWTDANGQVHYTAQPPAQTKQRTIKATNIEEQIKAKAGKYRAPKSTTKVAAKDDDTNVDSEKKSEDDLAGPNKQLVKYCNGQRDNLKQLKKNFRNIWIDAKGKKTNLTQEQRKEKVSMLQEEIDSNCAEVNAPQS